MDERTIPTGTHHVVLLRRAVKNAQKKSQREKPTLACSQFYLLQQINLHFIY